VAELLIVAGELAEAGGAAARPAWHRQPCSP